MDFYTWARAEGVANPEGAVEAALTHEDDAGVTLLRRWLRLAAKGARRAYQAMSDDEKAAGAALLSRFRHKFTVEKFIALHGRDLIYMGERFCLGGLILSDDEVAALRTFFIAQGRRPGPDEPLLAHPDGGPWTLRQARRACELARKARRVQEVGGHEAASTPDSGAEHAA